MDDPEATRRHLAEAEARLAADPQNQELRDQVRRLDNALGCLEWWALLNRLGARAQMTIDATRRRN